jgi:hypothetical protein
MQQFSSGLLDHMVWNQTSFCTVIESETTQLIKKMEKVNGSWTKGAKQTFASVEVLINL